MSPRTRVALLDAFGTCFSPRFPVHEQYDHVARMLGIIVDPLLLKGSFKRSFKEQATAHPLYGKLSTPPLSTDDWWARVISGTFLGAGYPSIDFADKELQLTSTLIQRFQSKQAYFLHSDVLPLLHSLPSHVRPIIVSGSDRGVVQVLRDLQVLGNGKGQIKEQDVLTTWDLERPKTDPAFWSGVLERLSAQEKRELKAEECLVVGDELLADYETPRVVGMRSLLLRRPETAGQHARASYEDETGAEQGLDIVEGLEEVLERLGLMGE